MTVLASARAESVWRGRVDSMFGSHSVSSASSPRAPTDMMAWRGATRGENFNADVFAPFDPSRDGKQLVTFELLKKSRAITGTVTIRVEDKAAVRMGAKAESGDVTEIESIKFSVDRKALRFPIPPDGSIKKIELPSADKLRSEVIDSERMTKIPEGR